MSKLTVLLQQVLSVDCRVSGSDSVEIHPAAAAGKGILNTLQLLLQQVPDVIVQGIPAVDRAVVNNLGKGRYVFDRL